MSDNFENNDSHSFIFTVGDIKTIQTFSSIIKHVLQKTYPYTHIEIAPHTKNNGLTLLGLTISDMRFNMAPTIYLDVFFQEYKQGRSIENICRHIEKIYEENKPKANFPTEDLVKFENIRNRICYKLINFNANKSLLETKPFIPYLDLAIIFYIPLEENNLSGSIDITNNMMKNWNISSAFDLFHYAHNNTEGIRGLRYGTMLDFMKKLLSTSFETSEWRELLDEPLPPVYVATNNSGKNGACCLLYEKALEKFADMVGGSFYILPSSLHEILIVPSDDEADPLSLIQMVHEVNVTALSADEVLSEHIYFYDEISNRLTLFTGLE